MSGWAIAVMVAAALSPAIAALRLPGVAWPSLWPGLLTAALIGTVLVVVAEPLSDWADVEPESFRVAAGLVLAATGLARLAVPVGRREEVVSGPVGWLVPVAYPVLVGPELVLALMAAGVEQRWAGVVGLAMGLALAGLAVARRSGTPSTAVAVGWAAAARMTAAVQVLLAIALTIDAIRSV